MHVESSCSGRVDGLLPPFCVRGRRARDRILARSRFPLPPSPLPPKKKNMHGDHNYGPHAAHLTDQTCQSGLGLLIYFYICSIE